jgi:hypothetical protein
MLDYENVKVFFHFLLVNLSFLRFAFNILFLHLTSFGFHPILFIVLYVTLHFLLLVHQFLLTYFQPFILFSHFLFIHFHQLFYFHHISLIKSINHSIIFLPNPISPLPLIPNNLFLHPFIHIFHSNISHSLLIYLSTPSFLSLTFSPPFSTFQPIHLPHHHLSININSKINSNINFNISHLFPILYSNYSNYLYFLFNLLLSKFIITMKFYSLILS